MGRWPQYTVHTVIKKKNLHEFHEADERIKSISNDEFSPWNLQRRGIGRDTCPWTIADFIPHLVLNTLHRPEVEASFHKTNAALLQETTIVPCTLSLSKNNLRTYIARTNSTNRPTCALGANSHTMVRTPTRTLTSLLTNPLEHPLQLLPQTIHLHPPRPRHLRLQPQHRLPRPTRPNLLNTDLSLPHARRLRLLIQERARRLQKRKGRRTAQELPRRFEQLSHAIRPAEKRARGRLPHREPQRTARPPAAPGRHAGESVCAATAAIFESVGAGAWADGVGRRRTRLWDRECEYIYEGRARAAGAEFLLPGQLYTR